MSAKKNSIKQIRPTSRSQAAAKRPKIKQIVDGAKKKQSHFLSRRPHRSFRLTRRRDYKRSLELPGYIALTKQVMQLLVSRKKTFLLLILTYAGLTALLSTVMAQDTYDQLRELVDSLQEEGELGAVTANLTLFWGVFTGQLAGSSAGAIGSSQQIFSILLGLYTWLATVWLLRAILAGKKPRTRDGVYASGGPVIALAVLMLVLVLQLLPAAVAAIAYGAADSSGLLDQTVILMLFGGGAILLIMLSLYWIVSTFVAMVIVTLPGMYPFKALSLAGDMVVGRRTRLLLRLLWVAVVIMLTWLVVLIPAIILDNLLKTAVPAMSWLPLVPIVALMLMSFSVVFFASYVYILYRKVVDDDAAPA